MEGKEIGEAAGHFFERGLHSQPASALAGDFRPSGPP